MSSIFNDRFSVLLDRIDRSNEVSKSPTNKPESGVSEPFSKILADLEPRTKKSSEIEKLASQDAPKASFSNLSTLELERAKARSDQGVSHEVTAVKIGRGGVEITPQSTVKMATGNVKEAAPSNLQMMPYVHAAKYQAQQAPLISLPEVSPAPIQPPIPSTPQLLSVKEITQPKNRAGIVGSREVQEMISRVSEKHGVDPALSIALAKAESSLNPKAVSNDGFASKGLFQLLDSTGNELAEDSLLGKHNYDPFNPDINADLGVKYLRRLMDTFSNETQIGSRKTFPINSQHELEKVAVAAFNAGEGTVTSAQHRAFNQGLDPTSFDGISRFLPKITQNHVERVMRYRSESLTG